jgi:hypothetical protein
MIHTRVGKGLESKPGFLKAAAGHPGVDVMITIFCDFSQFSAKNWRFY